MKNVIIVIVMSLVGLLLGSGIAYIFIRILSIYF
jgi:hypothetical protein